MRKTVVIGLLGPHKDAPTRGRDRWDSWRPSVSVCQQEDLVVHRFVLLRERRYEKLARQVAEDIVTASPETKVVDHEIAFADAWDFESVFETLLGFARDHPFDPENEDYLVHITTGTHVAQICLFLLTESRHLPARLLQSSPGDTRATHARGRVAIIDLDLKRYDQLASRFEAEHREAQDLLKSGIGTRNEAFNRQVREIEEVAVASRAPILLTGPTGAGKSQLARRIHDLRARRHRLSGPFVEVNCATLRGDGAMSALFGHRRGAFTGAESDREGLLRSADGGLLFLDEIGELGGDEQAMLLRALEERRFLPLGADREVSSDFQLIAGTHRDLHAAARAGRFREDLLARIDLWTFRLPGLAERREDIEPNLDYELELFARREGRRVRFNREARERYLAFAVSPGATWRGNFRDLNASVTRLATLSPSGRITVEAVEHELGRLRRSWGAGDGDGADGSDPLRRLLGEEAWAELDRFDRVQLADVVSVCRRSASLSAAGRELFAASRRRRTSANDADRLRKYLARHSLAFDELRADA
ncbi:MAG: RNA repair transcriptional activator RtcR [Planctomycetota bacterium]